MTDNSCAGGNTNNPYPGDCEFTAFLREKAAGNKISIARSESWKACYSKAKEIKLLLLDVDGVLTDGSITYLEDGKESKTFNARDGFGINILRKAGVEVGIITARKSPALDRRVQDLSLTRVYQGVRHKVRTYKEIIADMKLQPNQVAYMGDDWLDLPLLTRVGLSAAVADATPEVQEVVDFVSLCGGGKGAVRELCDLLIEAQGKRESLLSEYMNRQ